MTCRTQRPWLGGFRTRAAAAAAALAALASVWLTPLAATLPGPFSAHMITHMTVVAVAAPLLAFALAGTAFDPLRRLPAPLLAVPASLVELLVVWGWHAPALHDLARRGGVGFAAEQAMFLASALAVWLCVASRNRKASPPAGIAAGRAHEPGNTSAAGILALLLTSMHMTLLGALLALAPRPLYHTHAGAALADQQLGGALMLSIGGAVYLGGALLLAATLVRRPAATREAPPAEGVPS
jgi:putative membrane protein